MKTLCRALACAGLLLGASTAALAAGHEGQVQDSMDAAGYTYVQVSEGKDTFWIAGPQTPVKKGDTIRFDEQMWMPNFHSKSLDRDFERLLFVSNIQSPTEEVAAAAVANNPHAEMDLSKVPKPEVAQQQASLGELDQKGALHKTLAELMEERATLNGKTVSVCGKVSKVNESIMNMNWIHLSDEDGNDIIFRSPDQLAKVGDEVQATGVISIDKDFGFGYQYKVLADRSVFGPCS